MVVFLVIAAFLLGAAAGALVLWRALPSRLRQHVDYRQRWEAAVGLLGTQGRLTPEQVSQVTGRTAGKPEPAPVPGQARNAVLRELHDMTSWDRKDLEIARAKQHLPPVDDLQGMASWDKAAVLKARAKAGTG